MILNINAVKPLISLDTAVLQMDVGKISQKQLEAIVGAFRKPGSYEVKKVSKKRSLNANAYCWVLCEAIAQKLNTTKEEIYRQAVGEKGVFTYLEFKDTEKQKAEDAMEAFKKKWYSNGLGWMTKSLSEKTLLAFYGSSSYSKEEMNRLLDWLVETAQENDVPTMSDEELKLMIGRWKE